jgi:hypothetical protein
MTSPLQIDIDYYLDELGRMVLTKEYHLKRGHCCQSGCRHCPYDFASKVDPNYPAELQDLWPETQEPDEFDTVED